MTNIVKFPPRNDFADWLRSDEGRMERHHARQAKAMLEDWQTMQAIDRAVDASDRYRKDSAGPLVLAVVVVSALAFGVGLALEAWWTDHNAAAWGTME